jgi:hypothetical protein
MTPFSSDILSLVLDICPSCDRIVGRSSFPTCPTCLKSVGPDIDISFVDCGVFGELNK